MSERLDDADQALLRRVVLGELDADADEVRGRAAEHPQLARALAQWRRTREALERVRAVDDELVAAAGADATAADRDLVGDLVAGHLHPATARPPGTARPGTPAGIEPGRTGSSARPGNSAEAEKTARGEGSPARGAGVRGAPAADRRGGRAGSGRPGARSRSWRVAGAVGLAAAAAFALYLGLDRGADKGDADGRREPGESVLLGSEGCVRPRGAVEAYGPFVVDVELAPLWTLEIVVLDGAGRELARSGRLERSTWEPAPAQAAALADAPRIRWQYDVLDAAGDVRESGACEASRSQ